MNLPRLTFLALLPLLACTACAQDSKAPQAVDPSVSPETANLLANLHYLAWETDKIMFGQEFPLSYQREMKGINDPTTSDLKDVVGDHPGVHGSDFHYLIDKEPHERMAHTLAALTAYESGAVVTFDYHWMGKYGYSHSWHERDAEILYNVVNGDDSEGDVTWFYQELDEVLRIVNEELRFPIVFRPFHEMNGNWFWWGSRLKGGPETYRKAFQILVAYMSERSDHLLFCWSPDKAFPLEYYPGDDYVDVIGFDGYGQGNPAVHWFSVADMVANLEKAVDFAAARGKVAAFTETGYGTTKDIDYHSVQPDWWNESVLHPILESEKARHIAWILTWINSDWSGPYVPYANSPDASQAAFREFYEHPSTLFEKEVSRLKMYAPRDSQ
ncbi:glycosyl hydrolase family 26 [Pelagicoccus sp. NFK12]|uniref:Glycosyl hydrolase family 26 n=1 Tax=Pelagicoccus enzymogenes TaxID=2773457 RepID=A0A927IH94_9BACT|nr:glycosyl hydrolase [Pelagicoccus enzymogenes]MBD5779956.1 glycosyl hydrolase family 26 [Pelagicoccus enzymogenes]MDQ8200800.1 glycosyl hydrolase [Pelagicoccus enzymogenes]